MGVEKEEKKRAIYLILLVLQLQKSVEVLSLLKQVHPLFHLVDQLMKWKHKMTFIGQLL